MTTEKAGINLAEFRGFWGIYALQTGTFMLSIPRKFVIAVSILVDLAYNGGDSALQGSDITRRHGVPRRSLEPILQHLVRCGLLDSVRGPRGGYRLGRDRARISLADVLHAVEALEAEANGSVLAAARATDGDGDGTLSSALVRSVVEPALKSLREEMLARMAAISLDELCRQARIAGVDCEAEKRLDYVI